MLGKLSPATCQWSEHARSYKLCLSYGNWRATDSQTATSFRPTRRVGRDKLHNCRTSHDAANNLDMLESDGGSCRSARNSIPVQTPARRAGRNSSTLLQVPGSVRARHHQSHKGLRMELREWNIAGG